MNQSCLNIQSYPSKSQKLLLKAVFASQEEMPLAWEKWYSNVDIDELDGQSYHLLSPLYYQLSQYQLKTEEDKRLKGIYRRHWYSNQIYLKGLNQILETFNNHQINTIILGDLGINLGYYPELAIRPIHNYELFVTPKQANLAIELLTKLGWQPKFEIENINPDLYPKLPFTNGQGKVLFLYWQLWTHKLNFNNQEIIFTNIGKKITIGNNCAYILNPTEQVLNICLQSVLSSSKFTSRYLTDLKYIISTNDSEIDWQSLLTKISALNLSLSYKKLVLELNKIVPNIIPDNVLIDTDKLTITPFQKYEFNIINNQNYMSFKYKLTRLYLLYFRTSGQSKFAVNLFKFTYYLKYMWGLESLWAVPKIMLLKLIKKDFTEVKLKM